MTVARIDRIPRDNGQPVKPFLDGNRRGFMQFARQVIPPQESVRIVLLTKRSQQVVCGHANVAQRDWIVWALAPRPRSCDPTARWTLYVGTVPDRVPSGARTYLYRPDLLIVERTAGP